MTTTLKIHPAADWLPLLPESEYRELRDDIQKRGLREAILVKDDQVIDGRHRLRACNELGIEPKVEEYTGGDLIEEIASRNLMRRHLTPQQRAELVVKMCGDQLSADAQARKKAHQFGAQSTVTPKPAEPQTRGETAERIAKIARVGRNVAREALRARKDGAPRKPKSKPQIDKLDPKHIIKKFQKFMDYWVISQHRKVKPVILEFLTRSIPF